MENISRTYSRRNRSVKGVSAPMTAIIVSTALVLLASHVASSSFAAINSIDARQLNRNPAAAIHYGIESLCLSESPDIAQFITKPGPCAINISGSTITCECADFTGLPDPAGIVISSGEGFIAYNPERVIFKSECIVARTVSLSLHLYFNGDSGPFYLEAHAN